MADRHDADRQDQENATPGGLPLLTSGWGAKEWYFEPGEAFWRQIDALSSGRALAEQMDSAMEGKSAPRVWLIMHEPGQPELSAAVGLAFARELGARDQVALVLDCDDQSQTVTRWTNRLESDGWIDLARYGTSVLTSGVPLPFDGRRGYLLGVGSFAPTDITAEEIQQLVQRLRRQADDLILLAPADAIGELWAPSAGIRLLCWDRASRPAAGLEGLVTGLADTGCGLTGLVGFGLPMAESTGNEVSEPVLDDQPETDVEAAVQDEVDPVAPADDFGAPELPAEPDGLADVAAEADEAEIIADEEPQDVSDDTDQAGWTDAPAFEDTSRSKGTSGVFWFLATAAVVIVAILGVYWFKYVRIPENELIAPAEVAQQVVPERLPADPVQGDMANQDDPPGEEGSMATGDDGGEQPVDDNPVAAGDEDEVQIADAGPFEDRTAEAVPESTPESTPEPEPETDATPAAPVFSMVPYRATVGAAGWALHLYSFPDSTGADAELAELRRRGFETEIRVVQIPDKGRWWRIYVGSFESRSEAWSATPLLLEKLRTDWAKPTEF